jgi:hypothetical protein
MNYTAIYEKLIERARNRVIEEYSEMHHVIPRCMGGSDDKHNLVALTPEEHYIAHQLLHKMYPDNNGLLSACIMMTANRKGNKVYGWLKRKWSIKMKEQNPIKVNPACNARMGRRKVGSLSEEERANTSKRMKTKNPCHNIEPWNHPRATDETKAIWADAPYYYELWKNNGWSYHRLAKSKGFEKPTMTHNNMVKRFRNGWVP